MCIINYNSLKLVPLITLTNHIKTPILIVSNYFSNQINFYKTNHFLLQVLHLKNYSIFFLSQTLNSKPLFSNMASTNSTKKMSIFYIAVHSFFILKISTETISKLSLPLSHTEIHPDFYMIQNFLARSDTKFA